MTDILKSVIKMTRPRDVDSMEYSLVTTLAEIINCQQISLFKKYEYLTKTVIEEPVRLTISNANQKPAFQWQQVFNVQAPEVALLECLSHHKRITNRTSEGKQHLYLPIKGENNTSSALHICSNEDIDAKIAMIIGFCRVYENYLVILSDSERDKLTGLHNRQTFEKKLDRLLQRQQKQKLESAHDIQSEHRSLVDDSYAWLAMIDIDHFKQINDNYGHLYGDEVLLILSQKLQECFRSSDLLFRFGGEEFVIILEPIPYLSAKDKLEQFRSTIEQHAFPSDHKITISIGFTKITADDFPPTVLSWADKAMYYAKQQGRNRLYNYEELIKSGKITPPDVNQDFELF